MASLRANFQLLVDTPVRAFGFQRTPPYTHTEIMSLLAPYTQDNITQTKSAVQMAGLRAIPEAACVIFEASQVLAPTGTAETFFPAGGASDWREQQDSTTQQACMVFTNSTVDAIFDIATVDHNPANAGFYCRIGRGQPATGAVPDAARYWCQISVGDQTDDDGSGATPFRLVLSAGFPPFLQQGVPDGAGAGTGAHTGRTASSDPMSRIAPSCLSRTGALST